MNKKINYDINPLLFLGFSLLDTNYLKRNMNNEIDFVIFEIIDYYKKITANFFHLIEEEVLRKYIKENKKILDKQSKEYINYITGAVLVSELLIYKYQNIDKNIDLERFYYITSIFYDLYSFLLTNMNSKEKKKYQNSFEFANSLLKSVLK